MSNLAPICVFAYNRPIKTKKCLEYLSKCKLSNKSDIFIFIDGPKFNDQIQFCELTYKNCLIFKNNFNSFKIFKNNINNGLAKSILSGVSTIINRHKKVIVVEDDLLVSENFLTYHNIALDNYANRKKVFSISGYNFNLKSLKYYKEDAFFLNRSCSWGWSTWYDRWSEIDWSDEKLKSYLSIKKNRDLIKKGGADLLRMSKNQLNYRINSWSIKFTVHQLVNQKVTLYPKKSKLINIGFDSESTHTSVNRRFRTQPDISSSNVFLLPNEIKVYTKYENDFNSRFSFRQVILDKILKILKI